MLCAALIKRVTQSDVSPPPLSFLPLIPIQKLRVVFFQFLSQLVSLQIDEQVGYYKWVMLLRLVDQLAGPLGTITFDNVDHWDLDKIVTDLKAADPLRT